jgi:FMN phosphatase YigB (HAD superfamily)
MTKLDDAQMNQEPIAERREPEERRDEDRRANVVDRRLGLDRRRGPGRRRSDDRRNAEEGHMTDEQFDFLMAIDEYKRRNTRPFPTWTEVLELIKALGYRKVAEPQFLAPPQEDDGEVKELD